MPPTDARGRFVLNSEPPGSMSAGGTHHRLEGGDGPLVVLISGIFDPPTRYELMAPSLHQAGYRTLRYDPFGRGWSRAPAAFRFDAASHVQQVAELLAELALEPVALVAHSAGAIIAMLLAEATPSVKSLVLMAPAGAMASPLPGFRGLQVCLGACGALGVGIVKALMSGPPPPDFTNTATDEHAAKLARWDGAWHAAMRRANGNRALAASVLRLPLTSLRLGPSLRNRGVRALVLTATDDQQVRGVKAEFYREAFGADGVIIDAPTANGGHCFFLQDAEATHKRVLEFL